MKTIFIVDDNATNLVTAKNALGGAYKTYALPSAEKMFHLLEKITPDLILLDVEMPEMDGFQALSVLQADEINKAIPVVFLTAKLDAESEIHGFELGAVDFINKPFSPPVLIRRIETHIGIDKIVKKSLLNVREVHNATINIIANMVEDRDKVTGGHIDRTQKYLAILVNEMIHTGVYTEEISKWNLDVLLPSAQLHDVGKIKVSDLVLNKPGKLTDEEYTLIKKHCEDGESIINGIMEKVKEDNFLIHAKRFAGSHHEKWDGTGYPKGLAGENIPLEGRIMAIADVYDALVSERPYKKPFTHEQAAGIIKEGSGVFFDPCVVTAFSSVEDKFAQAAQSFSQGAGNA
ncbi:MAG: response regulator [Treponema sp.]|nr:response regulator [Treponema sp.]